MHRIAADFIALFLAHDGNGFCHGAYRPLGRRIGKKYRITQYRAGRRHVDDRAAAAFRHQRNGIFAAEENPLVHNAVHPAKLRKRRLLDIGNDHDTGIVYQNIKPAKSRFNGRNRINPGLLGSHIQRQRNRAAANGIRHLLRRRKRHIRHDNRRPFARQHFAIRLAQPLSAARYQRNLARNPAHATFSQMAQAAPPSLK